MGSRSSHLVSSEASSSRKLGFVGSTLNRTKRRLSSMFCGSISSKSTFKKLQDNREASSVFCIKDLSPVGASQSSNVESSSVLTSDAGDTRLMYQTRSSSGRNFSASAEDIESRSHQPAQLPDSGNARGCTSTAIDTNDAAVKGTSTVCSGHDQNLSHSLSDDLENNQGVDFENSNSDLRSLSIVSDSLPQFPLPGDGPAHTTTDSSPGFLVSDNDQDLRSGETLFHLDLVSISSNFLSSSIAEINSGETRRNSSRRQFWDALSRHSFRRNTDSPSIILAAGLADDSGLPREGWLLDFSDDHHPSGMDRSFDFFSARLRRQRNETRWLRSEVPGVTDGPNEGGQQTANCASGLHPNGECSCDSFFSAEESSSIASISRIIMLADALFEVLDEIHNQSLSLSLSTLSVPAPESTVDSFPLKHYKKAINAESGSTDAQQCYICLADYEEGDALRVLPCNHEYHVACVDKWLKEVNRICPLCRRNVCEGTGECSGSEA